MSTQISPEAFASAMVVAENLKQQLEARLNNKTAHARSCSCGRCGAGPSRVVGINIPTHYQQQIALCLLWECQIEDNAGKRCSQSITSYIPWAELYPMFRQAFAGIDVRVNHPEAEPDNDQRWGFAPSGRTIELSTNSAVFVRPIGDLSQSPWVFAELRIDKDMPQYATSDALIACNVNPLEFGQRRGRGQGHYYSLTEQSGGSTFYIRIPGLSRVKDTYLPIARQVIVNKEAGTATLELDQSVEVMLPLQA
jgi:hypothetical protein